MDNKEINRMLDLAGQAPLKEEEKPKEEPIEQAKPEVPKVKPEDSDKKTEKA